MAELNRQQQSFSHSARAALSQSAHTARLFNDISDPRRAEGKRHRPSAHWTIENRCHYASDWNFDEDRIRTGHDPGNITRLRRFAADVIQVISDGKSSVSQNMQQLNRNTRLVFDYLRMTNNLTRPPLL